MTVVRPTRHAYECGGVVANLGSDAQRPIQSSTKLASAKCDPPDSEDRPYLHPWIPEAETDSEAPQPPCVIPTRMSEALPGSPLYTVRSDLRSMVTGSHAAML